MPTSSYPELPIQTERIQADLLALAELTDPDLPYTRQAFTAYDQQGRAWLIEKMRQAGLEVRVDTAANLFGRQRGPQSEGPVVMMGSHIDTVRSGGRFDGIAGVVAALEVVRCLNEVGWSTRHPLEVASFTCEEPNAFGLSPFGSRVMAGSITAQQVATAATPEGETLAEGLALVGGVPQRLDEARRNPGDIVGFLELHIEQGGVLDREGYPIGVVTVIAAPCRAQGVIQGRADHAGATMMDERADALAGAAEAVLAVERICSAQDLTDTVGTVGYLNPHPNMVNVIPGRVDFGVDVRSTRQDYLDQVRRQIEQEIQAIARQRGLTASLEWRSIEKPLPIPDHMQKVIQEAATDLGLLWLSLPSRASHDAARIASIAPIGMIFVPSHNGLSHTPEEWTEFQDIADGAGILGHALMKLDGRES